MCVCAASASKQSDPTDPRFLRPRPSEDASSPASGGVSAESKEEEMSETLARTSSCSRLRARRREEFCERPPNRCHRHHFPRKRRQARRGQTAAAKPLAPSTHSAAAVLGTPAADGAVARSAPLLASSAGPPYGQPRSHGLRLPPGLPRGRGPWRPYALMVPLSCRDALGQPQHPMGCKDPALRREASP